MKKISNDLSRQEIREIYKFRSTVHDALLRHTLCYLSVRIRYIGSSIRKELKKRAENRRVQGLSCVIAFIGLLQAQIRCWLTSARKGGGVLRT